MIKKLFHNYFSLHSIRNLYISFIVIFILLPMLMVSFLSFYFTRKTIKENYCAQYRDAIQNEIEKQFSYTLKHAHLVIQNILTHNDIYLALQNISNNTDSNEIIQNEMASFLYKIETISGIEFYTYSGQHYSYFKKDIIPCKNPDKLFEGVSPSTLCISSDCTTDGQKYYLMIGGQMFNYYHNYSLGNFIVYINQDSLQSFYRNMYNNGCEVFLTIDGKIISHLDKAMIGKSYYLPEGIKNYVNTVYSLNKGYIITDREITLGYLNSPIKLQTIISYNSILKDIIDANIIVFWLIGIIFAVSLVLAIEISNRLTSNIRTLKNNVTNVEMYLVEQGVMLTAIPPKNELFLLENSFEEMRRKINTLLKKNNEMLNSLRTAELNALQAQINPHFLYNALAAVSWTAKLQKQTQIVKLVSALSSYFRIGLHAGENLITIREELKHVQSYIYVEQIRFPNLFDVVYNIDEKIMDCLITKIVLQPLVENSIKHGFKKKKENGHLIINGYTRGEDIILEVIDNGNGTDINPFSHSNYSDGMHYGLKNVQARLKMTYGEEYGLSFESQKIKGTTVKITIRKLKNKINSGGEQNV